MKKNTRRIISLFLACILAFGLAACGSGGESPSTDTKSSFNFNTEPTETTAPATDAANTGDLLSNVAGLPDKLENPNISIVYWYNEDQYKYDTSKNANVYDPILEAIPYFEEKYGGEVNVIYASWGEMLSTVISLQQAGEAPDLFEVYDESLYNVILSGVAQSIDDYITEEDINYYDVNMDTFRWEGKTYAIPLKPYTFYIMFNRDLFDVPGRRVDLGKL